VIEDEADVLIRREVEVNLSDEMRDNLMRVFELSKPEEFKERDNVALELFFTAICEDKWFDEEDRMDTVVRESIDKEPETLDALLARVSTEDYSDQFTKITWSDFMAPFCRRGVLRPEEELIFTRQAIGPQEHKDLSPEELKAILKEKLEMELKTRLVIKQNNVSCLKQPPTQEQAAALKAKGKKHCPAKGKYDVTVPDIPTFLKPERKNKSPSIRERKVALMVQEKLDEEEDHLRTQARANSVPRHVNEPVFERINQSNI